MIIDIVGEDEVTRAIIARLIVEFRKDITIRNYLPARGGQIKNMAPKYNNLGIPIILLTDLDHYNCAPELISEWFGKAVLHKQFLFRVAYKEAESWLIADRKGFSKWLNIPISLIPDSKIIDRRKSIFELEFPYKPSLYMMNEIISKSSKKELVEKLIPNEGARKGPAYNSAIVPFVKNTWDIENAAKNSFSLERTIERIQAY